MFRRVALVLVVSALMGAAVYWRSSSPTGPSAQPLAPSLPERVATVSSVSTPASKGVPSVPRAKTQADLVDALRAQARKNVPAAAESALSAPLSLETSVATAALSIEGTAVEQRAPADYVEKSSREVTRQEQQVLEMYESIAQAFDLNANDCSELGVAVSEFVGDNEQAVRTFAKQRSMLSAEERRQADERLEREAATQLARLRQSIRVGLGKCPDEKRLQDAIRALAVAGAS